MRSIRLNTLIADPKSRLLIALLIGAAFLSVTPLLIGAGQDPQADLIRIPPLSAIAAHSHFAKVNQLGYMPPNLQGDDDDDNGDEGVRGARVNKDFNRRPQNEPAVAVNLRTGTVVVGGNDYAIGAPVGGGVYTDVGGGGPWPGETYFPPFPLLCGNVAAPVFPGTCINEPPIGTGDPVVQYSVKHNEFYYTSIGFSGSFCENGVFLYRSLDPTGLHWTRPVVPNNAPPNGLRTVVYHDDALNCNIFHDKEWMVVDNNPHSPWYGRIYVTWTRFQLDPTGVAFVDAPIMLAFSDDRGDTFSSPLEVSGSSTTFCSFQNGDPGIDCDDDQFSVPVVANSGHLYVAFANFNNPSGPTDGFRTQYLVVRVTPAATIGSFTKAGPFQAVHPIYDGDNDLPRQTIGGQGRQTLCNSNFRWVAWGNIDIDLDSDTSTSNDVLYIVWADNRKHANEHTPPREVGPRSAGYPCSTGRHTDVDVFIIKSSNGGTSWTAPIQVNRDKPVGATNNRDQWFPWVSVNSRTGDVNVVYHDRRYDSSPVPNKLARTTVGTSRTLNTWSEVDAAGFPSNFDDAFFGTGAFIGDYNNILALSDGRVYAVFTGVSRGKTDSDIFIYIRGNND